MGLLWLPWPCLTTCRGRGWPDNLVILVPMLLNQKEHVWIRCSDYHLSPEAKHSDRRGVWVFLLKERIDVEGIKGAKEFLITRRGDCGRHGVHHHSEVSLLTFPISLTTRQVLMTRSANGLGAEVMCITSRPKHRRARTHHLAFSFSETVTSNYLDGVASFSLSLWVTSFERLRDEVWAILPSKHFQTSWDISLEGNLNEK